MHTIPFLFKNHKVVKLSKKTKTILRTVSSFNNNNKLNVVCSYSSEIDENYAVFRKLETVP